MIDTTGLFDIWSLVFFLLGIGATWVWQRVKCIYKSRKLGRPIRPPKWNPVLIAGSIATAGFMFIASQNSQNAEAVKELAQRTADCQHQFNTALRVRGAITQENDALSRIQRDAIVDWFRDRLSPPPDIAVLDPTNPKRRAWAEGLEQHYYEIIKAAQEDQAANDALRAKPENQYPEPTCGLEEKK